MKRKIKQVVNDTYVKDVITDYDTLSNRCKEFNLTKGNKDLQKIILELKNTIRANSMLGLSANQIGYDKRVFCLNFNDDIRTFINPVITNAGTLELSREKCHSIPNKEFIRLRHGKIGVTYQTPLGKVESVTLVGVAANMFQHHMDHLDGLLLSDVGLKIDEDFDKATEEERAQVIEMYLDSLDVLREDIEKDITEDKTASDMKQAVEFMQSVQKGETKVESVPLTEEEIAHVQKLEEEFRSKRDTKY